MAIYGKDNGIVKKWNNWYAKEDGITKEIMTGYCKDENGITRINYQKNEEKLYIIKDGVWTGGYHLYLLRWKQYRTGTNIETHTNDKNYPTFNYQGTTWDQETPYINSTLTQDISNNYINWNCKMTLIDEKKINSTYGLINVALETLEDTSSYNKVNVEYGLVATGKGYKQDWQETTAFRANSQQIFWGYSANLNANVDKTFYSYNYGTSKFNNLLLALIIESQPGTTATKTYFANYNIKIYNWYYSK